MSKGGPKADRASRLSSALRDNLRRRKAASRPAEGAGERTAPRESDTPPRETAESGPKD